MRFRVTFYATPDDKKPFVAFLQDVQKRQPILHKLLRAGLKKLEDRQHHRPPLTKIVDRKEKIWELRVGSANIARAFFFFVEGAHIIVTNGYVKKSQEIDERELDRARAYKREWEGRNG